MITKQQAIEEDQFHANGCTRHVGLRGGVTLKLNAYRRNGKTKVWKTMHTRWVVPVKYGMYEYASISNLNQEHWHLPQDCPALESLEEVSAIKNIRTP